MAEKGNILYISHQEGRVSSSKSNLGVKLKEQSVTSLPKQIKGNLSSSEIVRPAPEILEKAADASVPTPSASCAQKSAGCAQKSNYSEDFGTKKKRSRSRGPKKKKPKSEVLQTSWNSLNLQNCFTFLH